MDANDKAEEEIKNLCRSCGNEYPAGTDTCPVDGQYLGVRPADPLVGSELPRHYKIISRIGAGAMSVVYKGVYEPLNKPVAIKLLKSHLVADQQTFKRFQQEAKTAGSLDHPNIVGVLDFGVTDQAVPYIIMDYLNGPSLADILETEGRIEVRRALRIFGQAADALAYTHAQGVIHRDIKPSNIILINHDDEEDIVKIVDFGIAKLQSSAESPSLHLTNTGEVFGTPLYVSPEQAMGKPLDGRSDIYALGSVMYEVITGTPLYVAESAFDIIRKQILDLPQPMDKVAPDIAIPRALKSSVEKALAKDPELRYQSMAELAKELKTIQHDLDFDPSQRQSVPLQAIKTARRNSLLPAWRNMLAKAAGGKRRLLFLLGGSVLVLFLAATFLERAHKTGSDSTWRQYHTGAQLALKEGRWAEAEKNARAAVKEAHELSDQQMVASLNDLSLSLFGADKLPAAKIAGEKALDIAGREHTDKAVLAETLSNLSLIQSALGQFEEAEHLGRQALAIRQKLPSEFQNDLASSLFELAKLECRKKHYEAAEGLLERSLAIYQKLPGADSEEIAKVLHSLAMVNQSLGRNLKAQAMYGRALAIRQKEGGGRSPQLADTLTALGTLDYMQKDAKTAESRFKSALSIYRSAQGDNRADIAEVMTCLAILYEKEKKYALAEPLYRESLAIRQSLWGVHSQRTVKSLRNLSSFLHITQRDREAVPYELQIQQLGAKGGDED